MGVAAVLIPHMNAEPIPVENLLQLAHDDPTFDYPYAFVKDMLGTPHVRDPNAAPTVSVSSIISGSCPRCYLLERYTDYTTTIDNLWARWRGTALHSILERNTRDNELSEVSAHIPIEAGWNLSLRCDLLGHDYIQDWKFVRRITGREPHSSHQQQLQIYRWAFNHPENILKLPTVPEEDYDAEVDAVRSAVYTTLGLVYAELSDKESIRYVPVTKAIQVATKPGAKNPTKNKRVPDVWPDSKVEDLVYPRFTEVREMTEKFLNDGTLPRFRDGFNPMPELYWSHRYTATAHQCLELWYKEDR